MARASGQDILLDTAKGVPVPNTQATSITHPLASEALERSIAFPSQLRARAHPRYNCHGLTFASRRTAIHEDREVGRILQDDGYRPVDMRYALPGDIAIYFTDRGSIDHSALVVSKPEPPTWVPFVCSKWGVIGPEVYHLATQCPEYAIANIRYYRILP